MSIKRKFPTETELKEYISARSADISWQVKEALGPREATYREARTRKRVGFALVIGGFILVRIVIEAGLPLWGLLLSLAVSIALIGVGAVIGVVAHRVVVKFNNDLNKIIFPAVLQLFDLSGVWRESQYEIKRGGNTKILSKLGVPETTPLEDPALSLADIDSLDTSLLITEPRNTVEIEDSLDIDFNGRHLQIQELAVKHDTGSGKSRHVKHIFSGYFGAFELKTQLSHITIVSTDWDRSGFGYEAFRFGLENKRGLRVTELEWNDFEEKLHVLTSNETEARYVLTTNFMEDLYDWWKDRKNKIRISFIDKKMYILFSAPRVRFGFTIKKISDEDIVDYVTSIALPLLPVFHLLEDVSDHL
jgi:hypothetical protein